MMLISGMCPSEDMIMSHMKACSGHIEMVSRTVFTRWTAFRVLLILIKVH